jgi:hypothetical protein
MAQAQLFVVVAKGKSAEDAARWLSTLAGKTTRGDSIANIDRLVSFQVVNTTVPSGALTRYDVFALVEGRKGVGEPQYYEVD